MTDALTEIAREIDMYNRLGGLGFEVHDAMTRWSAELRRRSPPVAAIGEEELFAVFKKAYSGAYAGGSTITSPAGVKAGIRALTAALSTVGERQGEAVVAGEKWLMGRWAGEPHPDRNEFWAECDPGDPRHPECEYLWLYATPPSVEAGWRTMDSAPTGVPDVEIDMWVYDDDDPTVQYRLVDCMFVKGAWCVNEHLMEWEPLSAFNVTATHWRLVPSAPTPEKEGEQP